MTKKTRLRLKKGEWVVTAWAEPANGPGWSNTPLWYIVQDANGNLRRECLQPDEQNELIWTLYPVSAAMHRQMVNAVTANPDPTASKE